MKERFGVIYKITNKINGKVYIGQTTRKNGFKGRYSYKGNGIERVYNYYIKSKNNGLSYNAHLLKSIEKYGMDNFEVDEEFDVAYSQDELNKLEYMYIKIYKLTNPKFGYNAKDGGENGKYSKALRYKPFYKKSLPVICLNDNNIFVSSIIASEHYNISQSTIDNYCKYNSGVKRKTNLGFKNKTKLKFSYYYDVKALICLENNEIYNSIKHFEKKEKINDKNFNYNNLFLKGEYKVFKNNYTFTLKPLISLYNINNIRKYRFIKSDMCFNIEICGKLELISNIIKEMIENENTDKEIKEYLLKEKNIKLSIRNITSMKSNKFKIKTLYKNCSECGKYFEATGNKQKYCCDCAEEINRRKSKDRIKKYRNKKGEELGDV